MCQLRADAVVQCLELWKGQFQDALDTLTPSSPIPLPKERLETEGAFLGIFP